MPARNSRIGNETLSLKEFKEELGSFEGLDNNMLGNHSADSVAKWDTETVVSFLMRGGLEEYAEAFRSNQIVGENLLKMTDDDLVDLGIKARGHISKFRSDIHKLKKINEHQNRNRKLYDKLRVNIQNVDPEDTQQWRPWKSTSGGQNDEKKSSSDDNRSSNSSEGSDDSVKNSITNSDRTRDKKQLGSIDIEAPKQPKRKHSDDVLGRARSDDNEIAESPLGMNQQLAQVPPTLQLDGPVAQPKAGVVIYDKEALRPKFTKALTIEEDQIVCDCPLDSVYQKEPNNDNQQKTDSKQLSSSSSSSSQVSESQASNKDKRSKRRRNKKAKNQVPTHNLINEKDLKSLSKISEGSFGVVYFGFYLGKEVAVKVFKKKDKNINMQNFSKEVEILSQLRHKNIILLMGLCVGESKYMIVTEYMKNGSLYALIHEQKRRFTIEECLDLVIDIVQAMAYLHMKDILHCDLKTSNILVDKDMNFKLADFGLSRIRDTSSSHPC